MTSKLSRLKCNKCGIIHLPRWTCMEARLMLNHAKGWHNSVPNPDCPACIRLGYYDLVI